MYVALFLLHVKCILVSVIILVLCMCKCIDVLYMCISVVFCVYTVKADVAV